MLAAAETIVLVVDVQEKLSRAMAGREEIVLKTRQLVEGARVLGVPTLFTEQNPKGLGPTLPEIAALVPDFRPAEKTSFSCCGSPDCMAHLRRSGRRDVVVAGMETHVCVYQTSVDLARAGYAVFVLDDAVSSRYLHNYQSGLQSLRDAGCTVFSTETAVFQLLRVAATPEFKKVASLIR
jgi:nicotinamidase-related amidase